MNTLKDIQFVIRYLSAAEREAIAQLLRDLDGDENRVAESAVVYGANAEQQHYSVEQYLDLEQHSPVRHEYINGTIYAMTGATEPHELICGNLFAAIHAHVRGGPCNAYMQGFSVRLKINDEDIFYYPDVMVSCTRDGVDTLFLRYPKLIVEVLSPSTESIDRREKFLSYTQIPTLEEYVLVAQRLPLSGKAALSSLLFAFYRERCVPREDRRAETDEANRLRPQSSLGRLPNRRRRRAAVHPAAGRSTP